MALKWKRIDRGYAFACLSWTQGGTTQRKEQVIIDLGTPIRKIQDGVGSSTESEYVTENELTNTSPSQVTTLEWRQQVGDEKTGAGGTPLHVLSWTQGGTTQSNQHVIEDLETAVRKVQDEAARMVSQGGKTVLIISVAEHKTGREGHAKHGGV